MKKIGNNFVFTIGAQKSGTTAFHNLLSMHNEITLPRIKETHFFSFHQQFEKGTDWYLKQFDLERKIMCEVDPSYLFFPETADRIKETIESPKFIIIFRKPLERALSHYFMSFYRGFEELSFVNALKNEKTRLAADTDLFSFINHSYLERGNYSKQLELYFDKFDRGDFLFIKFENLISENQDYIKNEICNFIKISNTFNEVKLPESNKKRKIKSTMIRDLLYKDTILKRAAKALVPSDELRVKIKDIINLFNSKDYSVSESKKEIEKILKLLPEEYFHWNNQQTKLLSSTTGLDLSDWIYS